MKAPTTYIGNTTNEVIYRKVDELLPIQSKYDIRNNDQLIFIQNDAAKRIDAATFMERMIDRVTVPEHSLMAHIDIENRDGVLLHTNKTLIATSDSIVSLINGLNVGVSITVDYPGCHDTDSAWKLDLVLSDGVETSHDIYLSNGKPVHDEIKFESQVIDLLYFKEINTEEGIRTGWFFPNLSHIHDDRYYTQNEIDEVVTDIDNELEMRTLIDREEMENLLIKYQEYTGTEGSTPSSGTLPTITTPPVGETTANVSSNVMNSGDVSDLLYDLHMPVPYEVNYNYVTPDAMAAVIDTEGVAMDNDDAATLLRDIHNTP